MYLQIYGLQRNPFKNAPGSTSFYSSVNHKKILESLLRGLRDRHGLHLVLGENGTGKTTLCRFIQMAYSHEFFIGYLGNPFINEHEFLLHILGEFGIDHAQGASTKELMDAFGAYLTEKQAKDQIVALFIDEAHHLDRSLFDQLLVMANMQQSGVPLVQIVLCGLPQLLTTLAKPSMGSLNQRIGTRTLLSPLDEAETANYIRYRLEAARCHNPDMFSPKAVRAIWRATGGKPRLINHLCRLCLEHGAGEGKTVIDAATVKNVTEDETYLPLFDPDGEAAARKPKPVKRGRVALAGTLVVAAVLAVGLAAVYRYSDVFPRVGDLWPDKPAAVTAVVEPMAQQPAAAPTRPAEPSRPSSGAEETSLEVMRTAAEAMKTAAETIKSAAESVQSVSPGSRPQPGNPLPIPENRFAPRPELPESNVADVRGTYVSPELPPGMEQPPLDEPVAEPANEPPAEPEPRTVASSDAAPEPTAAEPAVEGSEESSPFQAQAAKVAEMLPPKFSGLRINAIAWHEEPDKRMVVLDDRILHEGDSVLGAKVASIGTDHVIISDGDARYIIRLPAR